MRAIGRALAAIGGALIAALRSRATLGLCAAILAATAVYSRYQQGVADAQNKCRSDISGAFDLQTGGSLFRIEDGLVAVSKGDDAALADMADRSEQAQDARDLALERRQDAVAICAADPDFDPYEESP